MRTCTDPVILNGEFLNKKNENMVFVLEFLALLGILGVLLIDFWVINDLDRERRENTFVIHEMTKQIDSNTPIPLAFSRQDADFMLCLCQHYRYVRRSRRRHPEPPSVQIHYIDTKKAASNPFKAEVIRCSEEYAIVDADKDHCAYVLRKGKSEVDNIGSTTFYLYAKFCYQRFKVSKKIGSSTGGEPTTIEEKSNDRKASAFRKIVRKKIWKKGSKS